MNAIWSIGCMSGTSMDGVDVAALKTDGVEIEAFGPSGFAPFSDADRALVKGAIEAAPVEVERLKEAGLPVNGVYAQFISVSKMLSERHKTAIEGLAFSAQVLGVHGQTIHHRPEAGETIQIPAHFGLEHLAESIVWEFRYNDVAHGGEGAPLVPFFHYALARYLGLKAQTCFLNIGGVANITLVNPLHNDPCDREALSAGDTGPGNALLNDFIEKRTGEVFDKDGKIAALGRPNSAIIDAFLERDYFSKPFPKSLDRNEFQSIMPHIDRLSTEDGAATLMALTVESIARAFNVQGQVPKQVLVHGGGRRNTAMMEALQGRLQCAVVPVEQLGLDGDMLEAQAFAYLAVRRLRGLALTSPSTTGVRRPVTGGIVSQAV